MSIIEVTGISKDGPLSPILKEISFTQRKSEKIAIVGETGSGKSTLLKIIAGLIQPDHGEVLFEGKRVEGPADKLVPGHDAIAYLSQHFELPQSLRVEQILEYANVLTEDEALIVYEICEIDHLLKRRTDQLSGGEAQRIAIARLLIGKPKLLLLDEPFSNLDMAHKNTLKNIVDAIGRSLDVTCMMISHDPEDTLPWADKILVMRSGQIIQKGTPEKIYKKPIDEYTAGLFGEYNILDASLTAMFGKAQGIDIRKTIIVRPENIKLTAKKTKAVKGNVTDINFFGSYYSIEIVVNGAAVKIRSASLEHVVGDDVFVYLDLGA